jgi:formamidopyrimidine-DNA glycosylase
MPELPEVEVVRLGISPYVTDNIVRHAVVRRPNLRWPIPADLTTLMAGQRVLGTARRSKYLMLEFEPGWLMVHLGMSGVLQWLPLAHPLRTHDHVDIVFDEGLLRLNDPRRFGAVLWHSKANGDVAQHALMVNLGIEPFDPAFSGEHMFRLSRGRNVAIKQLLLAGNLVVGVGNIYASESLFKAGIDPRRAAGKVSKARYQRLAEVIRQTLADAIEAGGSTLRDFRGASGDAGYFQTNHLVYDKAGLPCVQCATPIVQLVQGQRSTYYCKVCQK